MELSLLSPIHAAASHEVSPHAAREGRRLHSAEGGYAWCMHGLDRIFAGFLYGNAGRDEMVGLDNLSSFSSFT